MARAARTGYHHGALRQALLKHATKLLDKEGVEAVTIRAVARAADVSHAAPINHFESRNALLTALATSFFENLAADIDARVQSADDKLARVRAFAVALVEYGLRYPQRYRLMWRRDLLLPDAALQLSMDGIYERLTAELSGVRRRQGKSTHTVATAMWSLAHGYVSMRIDGMFEARTDEVTGQSRFEAMLDLLLGPAA
jgi:AcrR family transcriptional regulator